MMMYMCLDLSVSILWDPAPSQFSLKSASTYNSISLLPHGLRIVPSSCVFLSSNPTTAKTFHALVWGHCRTVHIGYYCTQCFCTYSFQSSCTFQLLIINQNICQMLSNQSALTATLAMMMVSALSSNFRLNLVNYI